MRRGEALTALVLGSVTRDEIRTAAGERRVAPGGVPTWAGTTLARLGAQVRVVTRLDPDERDALIAPLEAEGVEVVASPSAYTTTYALDYSGKSDMHELRATSDPIGPGDVPDHWRRADIVQLGPLHRRDLLPEALESVSGFTGIDVQGLVREPQGTLELPRLLAHVDVLQVSAEELAALLEGEPLEAFARRHGLEELLVTRGVRGATVLTSGGRFEVPAAPSSGRHRIGAGDVFLACYLLGRVRGNAPEAAASFAARVCAAKLDRGQVPKGYDPDSRT
jgi:sugar/nucleoside kinase (ribokinase family)